MSKSNNTLNNKEKLTQRLVEEEQKKSKTLKNKMILKLGGNLQ